MALFIMDHSAGQAGLLMGKLELRPAHLPTVTGFQERRRQTANPMHSAPKPGSRSVPPATTRAGQGLSSCPLQPWHLACLLAPCVFAEQLFTVYSMLLELDLGVCRLAGKANVNNLSEC